MERCTLITGVGGQDGSFLAELLLSKGYFVVGLVRRTSLNNHGRILNLIENPAFKIVLGDVTDYGCIARLIETYKPQVIYNLAAQSHVGVSFEEPAHTTNVVYGGCLNCLEAIRNCVAPRPRFYQASSSEMFGSSMDADGFQRETTPMLPNSPYAIAKLAAHNLVRVYRESYGIFACGGILMNHESPRRGETFVTRKITKYIGEYCQRISDGEAIPKLQLGNLKAKRDWGHAQDFVRGMWLMLQQKSCGDYLLATGKTRTVEEFVAAAFKEVGIVNCHDFLEINETFFRPNEVPFLRGDATKARTKLGWAPTISFAELVRQMVEADLGGTPPLEVSDR